jgi:hypothetical protein
MKACVLNFAWRSSWVKPFRCQIYRRSEYLGLNRADGLCVMVAFDAHSFGIFIEGVVDSILVWYYNN